MFTMFLAVALAGQAPAAGAGGATPKTKDAHIAKAERGPIVPGEYYLVAEILPVVPGAPTEADLDQVMIRLGKNDVEGAVALQTKGSGYLFCPPLRVKVAPGVPERRSAKYPSLQLARVEVVEGPFKGKQSWVPRPTLHPATGFPSELAHLAYAERVKAWRKDLLARPHGEEERPHEASAKELIAKRRAKKSARYLATQEREAEDARAQAAEVASARKAARDALPYLLEARGQDLRRQSELERNQMWNRFLNQGGAQGVIVGPPPQAGAAGSVSSFEGLK
jgi:hypothetical protein